MMTDPPPKMVERAGVSPDHSSSLRDSIDASLSKLAGRLDSLLESYGAKSGESVQVESRTAAASPIPAVLLATSDTTPPVTTHASTQLDGLSLDEIRSSKLMIVDDEEVHVLTVRHHLQKVGFGKFICTTDSRDALAMLRQEKPDLLLLDMKMPHVSGFDLLRAKNLDRSLNHFPVIALTSTSDPAIKHEALDLGAHDFLSKPVDPHELFARVRNALVLKRHSEQVSGETARLEELVQRRTEELVQSRQQLIFSLARAAEHRDNDTGNHVIRVGRYAAIIARELGWSHDHVLMLEQAAQLHDVGKIGVPDAILFKPGALDPQEYDIVKRHCAMGRDIINPFPEQDCQVLRSHARIGGNILHIRGSPMLMMASRIAQTHHECWDGSGYPLGLAGEDIPLEGRITAVADVYDALSSRRPYKEPFPRERCLRILEDGRGTRFDPQVLDAFVKRSSDIVDVQLKFMDSAVAIFR